MHNVSLAGISRPRAATPDTKFGWVRLIGEVPDAVPVWVVQGLGRLVDAPE